MVAAGKGKASTAFGTWVERLIVNQTNDDPGLGPDKRSLHLDGANPHPFLSDPAVRRALSLAIDRQILCRRGLRRSRPALLQHPACAGGVPIDRQRRMPDAERGGGEPHPRRGRLDARRRRRPGEGRGAHLDPLPDLDQLRASGDAGAGQADVGADRGGDGAAQHRRGGVSSCGDPASPDTYNKFYADIQMYTNNFDGTDPESYMANWACSEIPGPENQWLGNNNIQRQCVAEYDDLVAQMSQTAVLEERAKLAKRMNDIIVQNHYMIPLIWRGSVIAYANTLKGVRQNPWDSGLWNVGDWHR